MNKLFKTAILSAAISALGINQTMAQTANTGAVASLQQALEVAASESPEILTYWYDLKASIEEQRVAKGGYLPSVDLRAQIGHENARNPDPGDWDSYKPSTSELSLTQMLFDGFFTKYEVRRLNYEKRASYYDFRQSSESLALEVVTAYYDVLRFRKLVKLAEDNYVQHQLILDSISDRVASGLSRRVDQDQAEGRLSLAKSNLRTERSNLHDVSSRFLRLVGALPAAELAEPQLAEDSIPAERVEALQLAFTHNPELNATIERIKAARAELKRRDAPMMPTLDLRLRKELSHDLDAYTDANEGQYDEEAIELLFNYNLYRGGSDSAAKRQSHELVNQARAIREKVCRNVRQKVMIAHNDIQAQMDQVAYYRENAISIGRAREAYRKQFDIGQRTLLDLLDTENEYFEISRSLVNEETDLVLAKARVLEGEGLLLRAYSLESHGFQKALSDMELGDDPDDKNIARTCPLTPEELAMLEDEHTDPMDKYLDDPRFRKVDDNHLAFSLDVKFAFDSTEIAVGEQTDLKDAAEFLQKNQGITGVIEGHTDDVGSEDYNMSLSTARAESVKNYLIKELGISPDRLQSVGYGESRPLVPNDTPENRQINRRVEMVVDMVMEVPKQRRISDFNDLSNPAPNTEKGDELHKGWNY